jgi:hypothetical protein
VNLDSPVKDMTMFVGYKATHDKGDSYFSYYILARTVEVELGEYNLWSPRSLRTPNCSAVFEIFHKRSIMCTSVEINEIVHCREVPSSNRYLHSLDRS